MTQKIDKKITGYKVLDDSVQETIALHEGIKRPEKLNGTTYTVKPPQAEHALYITINDYMIDGKPVPFEIFLNSKNMEHFQWVIALTRVISACFRKGGEVLFLAEELKSVFDPKGGYFKKGGVYMPSLVAEIGHVLEKHINGDTVVIDDNVQKFIDEKRAENGMKSSNDFPKQSQLCAKCQTKAVVMMDGCMTCLNCGDSKCG